VVVVVVVAALFAAGLLTPAHASSSGPAFETFSQAESRAASAAAFAPGGPWYPVLGSALVLPVAALEPATNLTSLTGASGCTLTWPNGEPANVAIPATGAGARIGESAFWSILLKNVSNGLLVETVSIGVTTTLVRLGGSLCAEFGAALVTFPPGVIDSPAAVTAANGVGGSAFLAAYPNATQIWFVYGGFTFELLTTSPQWIVEDTSCAVPAVAGATGAVFNATIGGTSGTVTNHTQGTAECALTGVSVGGGLAVPLPGAAAFGRKAI
jgi:hypothetical protein